MKAIWKFEIEIKDSQQVAMPLLAEVLCAQFQHGGLCLWAVVETDNSIQPRTIEIFGTGHRMPEIERRYIGSVQMAGGQLVWHVFEPI
jgi:hypothetical protein